MVGFHNLIRINLSDSCWVDGFQRHIFVRKKYLLEIIIWCEIILKEEHFYIDDEDNSLSEIINSFLSYLKNCIDR